MISVFHDCFQGRIINLEIPSVLKMLAKKIFRTFSTDLLERKGLTVLQNVLLSKMSLLLLLLLLLKYYPEEKNF